MVLLAHPEAVVTITVLGPHAHRALHRGSASPGEQSVSLWSLSSPWGLGLLLGPAQGCDTGPVWSLEVLAPTQRSVRPKHLTLPVLLSCSVKIRKILR